MKEAGYMIELVYMTEGGKQRKFLVPPSKESEIVHLAKKKGWYWVSRSTRKKF